MKYNFDNERPIYLQLKDLIKTQIASGVYKPNEKLLSVRELASLFKVNPNTIQKALTDLEDDGLIYTERTNGKYVTDNEKLIAKVKNELAKEIVNSYLNSMNNIGIPKEEVIKYLQNMGGIK